MTSYRNSQPRPPIMQGSPPDLVPPRIDWDRPPWNRWSFQHVREIVPTVEVWRGSAPASRLQRNEVDLDRLAVATTSGAKTLSDVLDETYTDALLVLKDGAVAYERYFNGMTPRTLHLSQSVAKSVVGTVAAMLVRQGRLDPARPITDSLPELADTGWRGATLQHVLDMTTGVSFSEEYTDPYSEIGQLDVAAGWKPVPPGSDPVFRWPAHVWNLICSLRETERPHGETFVYRSIETDVLAFAMERVTGRRLAELVSEELWQKIGAEESACFTVDPAGYALADGGFNATLRDFARFGQFILEGGRGLLPDDWIEATRSPNEADQSNARNEARRDSYYRNQFWVEDPASRSLMCLGVFGQMIHVGFETQTVVVKLSSWPDFLDTGHQIATLDAVHAIAEELS